MATTFRRIVTGHDATGKAVVLMDGPPSRVQDPSSSGNVSALLWVTDRTPADISGAADRGDVKIGVPPPATGSIFRIIGMRPQTEVGVIRHEDVLKAMGIDDPTAGGENPRHPAMHRTDSVDYVICVSGEIDMLLDDSEVHMRAGDVMVQQATNHAWVNRGDEMCVVAFVLIGARKP